MPFMAFAFIHAISVISGNKLYSFVSFDSFVATQFVAHKKSPGYQPGLRYNLIKPKLTLACRTHICIALYFFEQQYVAATIFFAFVYLHGFYHVPFR
jgi:hypothetical protein